MKSSHALTAALWLTLCPAPALPRQSDQPDAGGSCGGQVFKAGEVARKARIKSKPEPGFTDEARAHGVGGTVRLTAVLCRTGRVTDIRVVQGLPHGMTGRAVEAARRMKFEPARKDGRKVSQSITLEYNFILGDAPGGGDEDIARHAGRLVEELIVAGNRRLTDSQLIAQLRTRPGDVFSEATVRRDLRALLDLGTLDTRQTRVTIEAGRRGGVVVIFTVFELPVIRDIRFKGLKSVGPAEALSAIEGRARGLRREGVYDPARVADARRAILELLAARGRPHASVAVEVGELSAITVELVFLVKEGPPARAEAGPGRWF